MIFDLAVFYFEAISGLVGAVLDTGHSMDSASSDLLLHIATFDAVDPALGEVKLRIIVDRIHADGTRTIVERSYHLHLYESDEIPAIVAVSGLEVIDVHGGFRGEVLGSDAECYVWCFRRFSQ
jgi:hypothetical protein